MDPAIGRRFAAPNYEDWIRDVSAVLPQWDGRQVLADSVSWADLQEPVLGMIQALQGSLQLPVWGGIPDCGDDTAIPSADPIAPRPGESLITAFGRHAAGRGHDSRRTDPALIAASRRHTRKRKAFLAGPNQTRSFPIPDSDASEDPGCRRHPRGDDSDEGPDDDEDMNDDDDPNAPRCMRPPADSSDDNKKPPPQPPPPHPPSTVSLTPARPHQ